MIHITLLLLTFEMQCNIFTAIVLYTSRVIFIHCVGLQMENQHFIAEKNIKIISSITSLEVRRTKSVIICAGFCADLQSCCSVSFDKQSSECQLDYSCFPQCVTWQNGTFLRKSSNVNLSNQEPTVQTGIKTTSDNLTSDKTTTADMMYYKTTTDKTSYQTNNTTTYIKITDTRASPAATTSDLPSYQTNNTTTYTKITNTKASTAAKTTDLTSYQTNNTTTYTKITDTKASTTAKTTDLTSYQTNNTTIYTKITDTNASTAAKTTDLTSYQTNNTTTYTKITDTKASTEAKTTDLTSYQTNNTTTYTKITDTKASTAAKTTDLTSYQTNNTPTYTKITDTKASTAAKTTDLTSYQTNNTPTYTKITDTKASTAAKTTDLTSYQTNNTPTYTKLTDTKASTAAKTTDLTSYQTNKTTTYTKITDTKASTAAKTTDLRSYQTNNTPTYTKITDTKASTAAKTTDLTSYQTNNTTTYIKITDTKASTAAKTSDVTSYETTKLKTTTVKATPVQTTNDILDCTGVASGSTGGVYTIYIENKPVDVYCEMTSGEQWTVIQKRLDGTTDFYRNWQEYKDGFGDANSEYWLGNENLHKILSTNNYKLRIDLEDWNGNTRYAEYDTFVVGSENTNYMLTISGYSGDAGDIILNPSNSNKQMNGMQFTTSDKDNDMHPFINCASDARHSGWWFNWDTDCNLNGKYHDSDENGNDGMFWNSWYSSKNSLKSVSMKIKPD